MTTTTTSVDDEEERWYRVYKGCTYLHHNHNHHENNDGPPPLAVLVAPEPQQRQRPRLQQQDVEEEETTTTEKKHSKAKATDPCPRSTSVVSPDNTTSTAASSTTFVDGGSAAGDDDDDDSASGEWEWYDDHFEEEIVGDDITKAPVEMGLMLNFLVVEAALLRDAETKKAQMMNAVDADPAKCDIVSIIDIDVNAPPAVVAEDAPADSNSSTKTKSKNKKKKCRRRSSAKPPTDATEKEEELVPEPEPAAAVNASTASTKITTGTAADDDKAPGVAAKVRHEEVDDDDAGLRPDKDVDDVDMDTSSPESSGPPDPRPLPTPAAVTTSKKKKTKKNRADAVQALDVVKDIGTAHRPDPTVAVTATGDAVPGGREDECECDPNFSSSTSPGTTAAAVTAPPTRGRRRGRGRGRGSGDRPRPREESDGPGLGHVDVHVDGPAAAAAASALGPSSTTNATVQEEELLTQESRGVNTSTSGTTAGQTSSQQRPGSTLLDQAAEGKSGRVEPDENATPAAAASATAAASADKKAETALDAASDEESTAELEMERNKKFLLQEWLATVETRKDYWIPVIEREELAVDRLVALCQAEFGRTHGNDSRTRTGWAKSVTTKSRDELRSICREACRVLVQHDLPTKVIVNDPNLSDWNGSVGTIQFWDQDMGKYCVAFANHKGPKKPTNVEHLYLAPESLEASKASRGGGQSKSDSQFDVCVDSYSGNKCLMVHLNQRLVERLLQAESMDKFLQDYVCVRNRCDADAAQRRAEQEEAARQAEEDNVRRNIKQRRVLRVAAFVADKKDTSRRFCGPYCKCQQCDRERTVGGLYDKVFRVDDDDDDDDGYDYGYDDYSNSGHDSDSEAEEEEEMYEQDHQSEIEMAASILGVAVDASAAEIEHAWLTKLRLCHPKFYPPGYRPNLTKAESKKWVDMFWNARHTLMSDREGSDISTEV